jgi:hypothetical protein
MKQNRNNHSNIRQAAQQLDDPPPCLDQAVAVMDDQLHLDQAAAVAEDLHDHKSCDIDPVALVYTSEVHCLHLFYTISTWLSIDLASIFLEVSFDA